MAKKNGSCRGIYERAKSSGIWWIRYADQNGRLHREKVGPKALAIEVYRKRKTEIREGKFFPDRIGRQRVVIFNELVDDYLAHSKTNKRSHEDDKGRVRPLRKVFGNRPARAITPLEIEQFKAALFNTSYVKGTTTRQMAPATVKHRLGFLRTIFNLGIKNLKVADNPAREVAKIPLNNERVRYFMGDEQDRMFAALPAKYHDAVKLDLLTGLRASNLLDLEWAHVDLDAGVYTIPHAKNGKALRLPLHADAKKLLASLPRNGNRYVFPGRNGQPVRSLLEAFPKAIRKAGIDNFHFHDLRHTFASRLAMQGVDTLTIKKLGGWRTLLMVERYTHLSPSHLRDALNRLPSFATDTTTRTSQVSPTETNTEVNGNSAPTAGSASNVDPA